MAPYTMRQLQLADSDCQHGLQAADMHSNKANVAGMPRRQTRKRVELSIANQI